LIIGILHVSLTVLWFIRLAALVLQSLHQVGLMPWHKSKSPIGLNVLQCGQRFMTWIAMDLATLPVT
jgi:hypothetical protein